jgi:hypothetical protein
MTAITICNPRTVRWVAALFALAHLVEVRFHAAPVQVAKLTPALLARAWTHSPPARSGCALSLRKILFTHPQCVQIAGQLVSQDPTSEPAEKLLERIHAQSETKSHRDAQE